MAYATDTRVAGFSLVQIVRNFAAMVSDRYAKRKVYALTVKELSSLSDRELADLGIARPMIASIAIEATYTA